MQSTHAMSQSSSTNPLGNKISGENANNLSPIVSLLHDIERQLNTAHEVMAILENKLEPIRASAPETATGGVAPREVLPTQMEQALQNIFDTARYLSNRINTAGAELRI